MSTEDVKIRVTLDTTEAQNKTREMERGFERVARGASSSASFGVGKILSAVAAAAPVWSVAGQSVRDASNILNTPLKGLGQDISNYLGLGPRSRGIEAMRTAGERALGDLGDALGFMKPDAVVRSATPMFNMYEKMEINKAENIEAFRKAVLQPAVDEKAWGGVTDTIIQLLRSIDSKFGTSMATGGYNK